MRMRLLLLWGFLLGLLLLTATGQAATFYVDASRPNDSGNGTSLGTAKQHIYAAIPLLSAGDTLNIVPGTYTEHIHDKAGQQANWADKIPSGASAGSPTILQAYRDGVTCLVTTKAWLTPDACKVILKPANVSAQQGIVKFIDTGANISQHIKFIDIVFDGAGAGAGGVAGGGSGTGCSQTANALCMGLFSTGGSHDIICERCEFRYFYMKTGGGAVFVGAGSGVDSYAFTIVDSWFHHNGGDRTEHSIYFRTHDNIVRGNRFEYTTGAHVHIYCSGTPATSTCADNLIEQNFFQFDGVGQTAVSQVIMAGNDNILRNNLFKNTKSKAIRVEYDTPNGTKIHNNTVCSAPSFCIEIASGSTGIELINNLCVGTSGLNNLGTSTTNTTNSFLAQNAGVFVNECGDLHLKETDTIATNTGTDLSAQFTTDYAGTTRTGTGAGTWERGAYSVEATVSPLHLEIATLPTSILTGATFTVVAEIRDEAGTLQDLDSGNCTIAKASGSGTIGGTLTATPTDGICTWSNLTLDAADTYTVTITRASTTSVTSSGFVVQDAPDPPSTGLVLVVQ